jgi:hypothetical protein
LRKRVVEWLSLTLVVCQLTSLQTLNRIWTISLPLRIAQFTSARCHIASSILILTMDTLVQSTSCVATPSSIRSYAQFS